MIRRYGHGHSVVVGMLLALALERHLLVFALLVFCAGLIVGRAWAAFVDVSRAVKDRLLVRSREGGTSTRPAPVYDLRSRQVGRDDRCWSDDPGFPFGGDAA